MKILLALLILVVGNILFLVMINNWGKMLDEYDRRTKVHRKRVK